MHTMVTRRNMFRAICILLLFTLFSGCGIVGVDLSAENTDSNGLVSETVEDRDRVEDESAAGESKEVRIQVEKGGNYSGRDEVAEYIHVFGTLPQNYMTKKEAEAAGWNRSEGNLWRVTERKSIGGDYFGNREGLLPDADSRRYYECDVNYSGGYRGPERIVFSNDGLIFYTPDHYESFERIY